MLAAFFNGQTQVCGFPISISHDTVIRCRRMPVMIVRVGRGEGPYYCCHACGSDLITKGAELLYEKGQYEAPPARSRFAGNPMENGSSGSIHGTPMVRDDRPSTVPEPTN
jgi:hypothetical protein